MILCADIGGSFIDFAVVNPNGYITHRQAKPTPVNDLAAFVETLGRLCEPWPDIALHIAIAGVEDPQTGVVHAANIPSVAQAPMAALLGERTRREVLIANDADCFALAEARFGVGCGHQSVFGVILGTGVGGGLAIDGRILRGIGGVSGEWGHAPLIVSPPCAPEGIDFSKIIPAFPCGCGQIGCLDTIAGARGLERLHRWAGGNAANSYEILKMWQQGDQAASRTLDIYINYLSSALALVVNVTGATIMPVGGGLGSSALLIAAIDEAVRERILVRRSSALVVPTTLGNDAGLLGAACLLGSGHIH